MSAPRKIWAAFPDEKSLFPARAYQTNEGDHLYHHDDVVRELLSIAQHAIGEWESWIESEYAGTSSYDGMIAEVHERRVALAKIAQEWTADP